MKRGKWYLVYTYTDEMEAGMFRDGVMDAEVLLSATGEDNAVTEAKAKWAGVDAASRARRKEQRRTRAHPPANPSERGPRNPRVVYKFPLK